MFWLLAPPPQCCAYREHCSVPGAALFLAAACRMWSWVVSGAQAAPALRLRVFSLGCELWWGVGQLKKEGRWQAARRRGLEQPAESVCECVRVCVLTIVCSAGWLQGTSTCTASIRI